MSIFAETVSKAISDYRQLLRRYLPQAERIKKLAELNLKDASIYEDDVALFRTVEAVIRDVEDNMKVPDKGYYSYSGLGRFAEYMKEYLGNYSLESGRVEHRAQKASRALIQAIQLCGTPAERLNDSVAQKLLQANTMVSDFGSEEQRELYRGNLQRQQEGNDAFFAPILAHFEELLAKSDVLVAAAAT